MEEVGEEAAAGADASAEYAGAGNFGGDGDGVGVGGSLFGGEVRVKEEVEDEDST